MSRFLFLAAICFLLQCCRTNQELGSVRTISDSAEPVLSSADADNIVHNAAPVNQAIIKETLSTGSIKTRRPTDVIFVHETSPTMLSENLQSVGSMAKIAKSVKKSENSDNEDLIEGRYQLMLDYKVFIILDNSLFGYQNSQLITVIDHPVGTDDALKVLKEFFDKTLDPEVNYRKGSTKSVVFITDNNANELWNAEYFLEYIETQPALHSKVMFNGLVGLSDSVENDWCQVTNVGNEYLKLINHDRHRGGVADICIEDWSEL